MVLGTRNPWRSQGGAVYRHKETGRMGKAMDGNPDPQAYGPAVGIAAGSRHLYGGQLPAVPVSGHGRAYPGDRSEEATGRGLKPNCIDLKSQLCSRFVNTIATLWVG